MESKFDIILTELLNYKAGVQYIDMPSLFNILNNSISDQSELGRLLNSLRDQGLIHGDQTCMKVAITPLGEAKILSGGFSEEKKRQDELYSIAIKSYKINFWVLLIAIATLISTIVVMLI